MTSGATFTTATGLTGTWPEVPTRWSYSSLATAGRCPRQYALERATFPAVWDRAGYPDRVNEASMVGTAVHEGVEVVLRALKAAGCVSLADERAVAALRGLGGYTAVAATGVERALATVADNPRMSPQLDRFQERLERRIPEMRRSIQALVARMSIEAEAPPQPKTQPPATGTRSRVAPGVHPEVTLVAQDDRFMGRVDLLTVASDHADILDFKTGEPAEHHADQVVLYGLLWRLDVEANPDHIPVRTLALAYVGSDRSVEVPSDWEVPRQQLAAQIDLADRALLDQPPTAKPSKECWWCPVRHMCDEYWASDYLTRPSGTSFRDAEVIVLGRNGPKSWSTRPVHDSGDALLRTTSEDAAFDVGQRLRILDAAVGEVEDETWSVITLTGGSEVYRIASP